MRSTLKFGGQLRIGATGPKPDERAVKRRKTHRNAHDFDGAFIRHSMGSEGEEPERCLPFYYF